MNDEGRAYLAVPCDEQGNEKPGGRVHHVVTAPDGEALVGTCGTLRRGSWFVEVPERDPRPRCRVCIGGIRP